MSSTPTTPATTGPLVSSSTLGGLSKIFTTKVNLPVVGGQSLGLVLGGGLLAYFVLFRRKRKVAVVSL